MKLDKEFNDAIHAINVLRDKLRKLKQNQTSENKALLEAGCNVTINNIQGLREFDR